MKRKSPEVNDPTKNGTATFDSLMALSAAYPHCRKMWRHHSEVFGDIYGLRHWFGYDWYFFNQGEWRYLTRTWIDRANGSDGLTFSIQVKAKPIVVKTKA